MILLKSRESALVRSVRCLLIQDETTALGTGDTVLT